MGWDGVAMDTTIMHRVLSIEYNVCVSTVLQLIFMPLSL